MQETRVVASHRDAVQVTINRGPEEDPGAWSVVLSALVGPDLDTDAWLATMTPDAPQDRWTVEATLAMVEGAVRVEQIAFRPPPAEASVLALGAQMRAMRLGDVQRRWEKWLFERVAYLELPEEWRRSMLTANRPGRRGHPDIFYALWAERYVAALAKSKSPTKHLVDRFEGETADSINRYLRKAEDLEFLTGRPGRGKAGGELTAKARALLDGND